MGKYSTHVLIINKTRWTITGDYISRGGTRAGAIPPPIPSGEASPVLTANEHVLKPAEGTYVLALQGPQASDPEDVGISFREGCPYAAAGHNYWNLIKRSPFVRVEARFGRGRPTADPGWGSPNMSGGEPLGIQITISEQPPVKRLSALTYNTHLFQGSPADEVIAWVNHHPLVRDKVNEKGRKLTDGSFDLRNLKPVVYKDGERQAELIRRLLNPLDPPVPELDWPPDIVCLQEVWDDRRKQAIRDALRETYPYCYIPPNQGYRGGLALDLSDLEKIGAWFAGIYRDRIGQWIVDGKIDNLTNSSGLMVLSKFPIVEPAFQVYEGATKIDDMLAKKGALTFRVRVPLMERGEFFDVRIGTTHAFVPTAQAQKQIGLLASQTLGELDEAKRPDTLMLGDFNISERGYYDENGNKRYAPDGEVGQEYLDLMETMNQVHAKDVVEEVPGSDYGTYYTDWQDVNTFTHLMEQTPMPDPPDPAKRDRIDYVFFRPGTESESHLKALGPSGVRVFHNWKIEALGGLEVSDHMPVLVEFAVVPSAPEAAPIQTETERAPQPVG